jgi:hypothetical protein
MVLCPRGRKAIVGSKAHAYLWEAGGGAAATPPDAHFTQPSLVAMENLARQLCSHFLKSRWKTLTTFAVG